MPFIDNEGHPTFEKTETRNSIAFRLSNSLSDEFLEELTNEKIFKSIGTDHREVHKFKPVRPGARTEALDIVCYAIEVRQSCFHVNFGMRARRMTPASGPSNPVPRPAPVRPNAPRTWNEAADRYKKISDMNDANSEHNSIYGR